LLFNYKCKVEALEVPARRVRLVDWLLMPLPCGERTRG
jgi:hypothetical protein